ncbi:MAG: exosortase A [Candidatus Nitrosoglobus sp.]
MDGGEQVNLIEQGYKDKERLNWTSSWLLAAGVIGAVLIALLLLYFSTVTSITAIWWRSETFAHGMLIFPICAYMIWTRRQKLQQLQPRPRPIAVLLILLLTAGWLLARIADVLFVEQLLLIAMFSVIVWGLLGDRVVCALAFPLAYLFFAVPFGEALIPPLQDFTAAFTVKSLQLSGIPIYWEGRYLSIPSGTFLVAEACSGLRYLIASVALGTLYAYLNYYSYRRRVIFIIASVIVPIIANGIRAYAIVMLAYLSNMKLATGIDHIIYGWIFFSIIMFLLFWVGSFWRETDHSSSGYSLPKQPIFTKIDDPYLAKRLILIGTTLVMAAGVGPVSGVLLKTQKLVADCVVSVPGGQSNWAGPFTPVDTWEPDFLQMDQSIRRIYLSDNNAVQLLVIYYQQEHQGVELISSQNHLYDSHRWRRVAENNRVIPLGDDDFQVHETVMRSTNTLRVVWHWYDIASQLTVSPIKAKFLEAWAHLTHQTRGSMLIAVAADSTDGSEIEKARALLLRFLNEMPAVSAPGPMLTCKQDQAGA